MKWIVKNELWQVPQHQAKYKNHLLKIGEKTEGFGRTLLGYYFLVTDIKTNKTFNSLWQEKWYKDLEEAKKEAINYVDNKIKLEKLK